ncbi:hypothetical protein TNCV_3985311 [Trichonephila clavipes]|nr:hypothetical protein TNCV_3985311 [Trichonephila clavipes]
MQPILVDLPDVSYFTFLLAEMQNDASIRPLFDIKGVKAWLCVETKIKYPNSTKYARKLLPFPTSYLIEYSGVTENIWASLQSQVLSPKTDFKKDFVLSVSGFGLPLGSRPECEFSAINDLLLKRNMLDTTKQEN